MTIPSRQTNTVWIYALKDPDTLETKYVGKSCDLRARMHHHVHLIPGRENTPVKKWIAQLLLDGKRPLLEILEESDPAEGIHREMHWINQYPETDLLNIQRKIHPPLPPLDQRRKRGRPKGRRVTEMRGYRLTDDDVEAINWLAAKWGKTHVAALRAAVQQACEREGKPKAGS